MSSEGLSSLLKSLAERDTLKPCETARLCSCTASQWPSCSKGVSPRQHPIEKRQVGRVCSPCPRAALAALLRAALPVVHGPNPHDAICHGGAGAQHRDFDRVKGARRVLLATHLLRGRRYREAAGKRCQSLISLLIDQSPRQSTDWLEGKLFSGLNLPDRSMEIQVVVIVFGC